MNDHKMALGKPRLNCAREWTVNKGEVGAFLADVFHVQSEGQPLALMN